jgi:hypothetical protein
VQGDGIHRRNYVVRNERSTSTISHKDKRRITPIGIHPFAGQTFEEVKQPLLGEMADKEAHRCFRWCMRRLR